MQPEAAQTAITELLKLCEELYFERSIATAILKEYGPTDWKHKYEHMQRNTRLRAQAHSVFEGVAQKLKHAQNASDTLQSLIQMLPVEGKPN